MSLPSVSLLITGGEVLDGRILDSNSRHIGDVLSKEGMVLGRIVKCGDDITAIVDSTSYLLGCSDILIVSGGLGPTTDDVTRDGIAQFLGKPLVADPVAREHITQFFAKRKRAWNPINERQTLFPEGSTRLPNPVGTALGFYSVHGAKHIFSVPGVPSELYTMIAEQVIPRIRTIAGVKQTSVSRILKTFGLPESEVGGRIESLALDRAIVVGYRAAFPEVHVVLRADTGETGSGDALISEAARRVIDVLGAAAVFSSGVLAAPSLEDVVHDLLLKRSESVGVAESCTGGLLGAALTRTPGSSAYFLGGVISYSNDAKVKHLRVPPELIATHGPVSSEVAVAMAQGARHEFNSTYGISVTGVAGPDGGTDQNPVGTFYIGLATPQGVAAYHSFYPTSRERLRVYAVHRALDLLRREIMQCT